MSAGRGRRRSSPRSLNDPAAFCSIWWPSSWPAFFRWFLVGFPFGLIIFGTIHLAAYTRKHVGVDQPSALHPATHCVDNESLLLLATSAGINDVQGARVRIVSTLLKQALIAYPQMLSDGSKRILTDAKAEPRMRAVVVGKTTLLLVENLERSSKPVNVKPVEQLDLRLPFDGSAFCFTKLKSVETVGYFVPATGGHASRLTATFGSASSNKHRVKASREMLHMVQLGGDRARQAAEDISQHENWRLRPVWLGKGDEGMVCLDRDTAKGVLAATQTPLHLVALNKYPLTAGSGLLAPFVEEHRSQLMTQDALEVGLEFAGVISAQGWRVGFNSLFAGASVNHLHFQYWHLKYRLPIEAATTQPLAKLGKGTVSVSVSVDYPISFVQFRFSDVALAAETIQRCIDYLIQNNIPHNMVVSEGMAVLVPRNGNVAFDGITPGFPEVAGQPIITSSSVFDSIDDRDLLRLYKARLCLKAVEFERFKSHIQSLR